MVGEEIIDPLVSLWNGVILAIPGAAAAIVILVVGYIIGLIVGHAVREILVRAGLDKWLLRTKLSKSVGNASLSVILGTLTKWWIFIAFMAPAAAVLKLGSLSTLLLKLAVWLPNLIVAIIILLFGIIVADYAADKVIHKKVRGSKLLSDILKIVIVVFIAVIALAQLGVKVALAEQTFLIVIGAIALAFAIAIGIGFGIALKDEARYIIRGIRSKI